MVYIHIASLQGETTQPRGVQSSLPGLFLPSPGCVGQAISCAYQLLGGHQFEELLDEVDEALDGAGPFHRPLLGLHDRRVAHRLKQDVNCGDDQASTLRPHWPEPPAHHRRLASVPARHPQARPPSPVVASRPLTFLFHVATGLLGARRAGRRGDRVSTPRRSPAVRGFFPGFASFLALRRGRHRLLLHFRHAPRERSSRTEAAEVTPRGRGLVAVQGVLSLAGRCLPVR